MVRDHMKKNFLGVVYFGSFVDKAGGKICGDNIFRVQKVIEISA